VPFVIFAWIAGVSVGKLFMAGVLPGILMGGAMMLICYIMARRNNYPKETRASFKEICDAMGKATLPLLAPLIILGGIYSGVVTPTEAAMVATLYAMVIGIFAYRRLKFTDFSALCLRVAKDTSIAMFIVCTAAVFNWVLTREQIPLQLSDFILHLSSSPVLILMIVNVFLLILGMFMENTAIMVIFTPILLPIMTSIGVDPIHFGVFFTLNMMIGILTPPFGIVLFVLSGITKLSVGRISKALIPFYIGLLAVLFLVTYVPEISMFLPRLMAR
jgi:C4-dicarboxylate transporter DctM subunit